MAPSAVTRSPNAATGWTTGTGSTRNGPTVTGPPCTRKSNSPCMPGCGCEVVRPRHPVGGPLGAPHRDPGLGAVGVVLAHDVVAAQVEAVVGVQVAEEDGVDGQRVDYALQRPEGTRAEVEQHPPGAPVGLGLEQVAARRRVGPGVGAGAADHREPHRSPSPPANCDATAISGPRKRRPIEAKSSGVPVVRKSYAGLAVGPHQAGGRQHLPDVLRALLGARHQRHLVAHHQRDHAGEQRVVGAAEHQGVDAGLDQRVEVVVGDREQLVAAGDAGLDVVDEVGACPGQQVDVGGGGEGVLVGHRLGGRAGADDADPAVAGRGDRPPGRRQDHLDDRDVVALPGVAQHRGAGGVAGDDQRLDAALDEVVEALEGVLAHLGDPLGPYGWRAVSPR